MENQSYYAIAAIIATLIACGIGSFLGFIYQSISDKKKNKKNLLTILMAYRGGRAYEDDFISAINMIDLYYYDNKEVRSLCHSYIDALHPLVIETDNHQRILHALLLSMARDCGYKDLQESDVNHYYFPEILSTRYASTNAKI